MTDHLYHAYGLVLAMPFACPELEPAGPGDMPDVVVSDGPVPHALPDAQLSDQDLEVSRDAYLLRYAPARARFLVERGRRVTFERGPDANEAVLRHVLLHQIMAALLRQRGMLVLHASGAVSPRGVVLVGGASGAGKSTTTAALTKLGWPLQSDDVSALRLDDAGEVEVVAGASNVHLFESASEALSLETKGLTPNPWHRMKIALPALVEPVRSARPLRRIVHLEKGTGGDLSIETVSGYAKLELLLRGVYGPYLAEQFAAGTALVSKLLQSVEMIRVVRPESDWTMNEVLSAVTPA